MFADRRFRILTKLRFAFALATLSGASSVWAEPKDGTSTPDRLDFGQVRVGGAAWRDRVAMGAGDAEVDATGAPGRQPDRIGLGYTGEAARKVRVVLHGNRAPQGQHRQRRVSSCFVARFAILATGGRHRVVGRLDTERPPQERGELATAHVALNAQAFAIAEANVVLAAAQAGAFLVVAELDDGAVLVVLAQRIDMFLWTTFVQGRHLRPELAIHPHFKRRFASARRAGAHVGQWRLL